MNQSSHNRRLIRKKTPSQNDISFGLDHWYEEMARRLYTVLLRNNCDLVFASGKRRKVSVDTLAKQLRRLESKRFVTRQVIENVITFLESHYGDTYTPKIYKVSDLFNRWTGFVNAMQRYQMNELKKRCVSEGLSFERARHIEEWFLRRTGAYRKDGETWTDEATGIRYWRKGNDLVWFDGGFEVHESACE